MNYLINKTNTRMHVMNLSTNQSLHSPCRYQSENFLFCLVPNKSFNAFNFPFLLTGNNFFSLLELVRLRCSAYEIKGYQLGNLNKSWSRNYRAQVKKKFQFEKKYTHDFFSKIF